MAVVILTKMSYFAKKKEVVEKNYWWIWYLNNRRSCNGGENYWVNEKRCSWVNDVRLAVNSFKRYQKIWEGVCQWLFAWKALAY